MKQDFQTLLETLQDSIITWDYFVDFQKVQKNIKNIERELALLNTLIGKENIEIEFLDLVKEYPKVRKILPILIAVRKKKMKEVLIKKYLLDWYPEEKSYLFYEELTKESEKELLLFFEKSGLKNIFQNKNIKSVVDYVFGVEVGMDTNARKNRTGDLMEELVGIFIADFCSKNPEFEYLDQATKKKIKEKWNYEIEIDKNNRRFDFAIFNTQKKELFIFEVNYFSGGGSKLKSVAGEFQTLSLFLKQQNLSLYWITDGKGWIESKKPLEEAFEKNEGKIFNIKNLKDGLFQNICK